MIGEQRVENVLEPIDEIEIDGMEKPENIFEIGAKEEIIILGKEKANNEINNEKIKLNVFYNENDEDISETKREKYKEINELKKQVEIEKEKMNNILGKITQLENELNEE